MTVLSSDEPVIFSKPSLQVLKHSQALSYHSSHVLCLGSKVAGLAYRVELLLQEMFCLAAAFLAVVHAARHPTQLQPSHAAQLWTPHLQGMLQLL